MLQNSKSKYLYFSLVMSLVFFISAQNILAQGNKTVLVKVSKDAIGNLKSAIKSENPGLRKSGIYLAGKHSISDVSETLLEQLKVESDPNLRILIIRVLYIIDDEKYVDDIAYIALNDENLRVRKMASAIYAVMQINNSQNFVVRNK